MNDKDSEERKQAWDEYWKTSAEMAEYEREYMENHWVHDFLETPEVLIAVLETKTARAVLAERERIRKVAQNWISELEGHDGECDSKLQAEVLNNFIKHDDFNEKTQTKLNTDEETSE